MTTMYQTLKAVLLGTHPATTVYECRNCGLSVDADTEECPICSSTDIASYEIR